MIRIVVAITHAYFAPERREALARLRARVATELPDVPVVVIEDKVQAGSLWCWRDAMRTSLELHADATHVLWLTDDIIPVPGFGVAIQRAIAARPDVVFDCFGNHDNARDLVDGWYTTTDGWTGGGGVIPRALLEQHLAWRDRGPGWMERGRYGYLANDAGVNVWAMREGHLIWKTARSLVDHDTTIPSLDGNGEHEFRKPLNLVDSAYHLDGWDKPPVRLGRTYQGNCYEPMWMREFWGAWDNEWSYRAVRGGLPVSDRPHVFIAMPAYVTPELPIQASLERTMEDLKAHDILVSVFRTQGDSLVTRGRHCLEHEFMCSAATHFLQWDSDLECQEPRAVRKMLASGHDIVGCAYPWRDGSGRVVCNPSDETRKTGEVTIDPKTNCLKVSEIGTGFLMVSRKCIVDLRERHPELMYQSDIEPYAPAPMWALFDSCIEAGINGRPRFASEDWRFCTLARQAGYDVHCYYPPIFRHWGKKGHEGHITKAWGMGAAEPRIVEERVAAE